MIDYEKAMVNRGSWYRIQQVMRRAERGAEITLGFLGGSITQGSLATKQENCYREELWGGLVDHIRIDEKSSTVVFRGGIEITI